MPFGLAWSTVALVLGIVFLGGLTKGVAGFGYAIASTALLATILEPSVAVTVMILPTLLANVTLLGELDRRSLRTCLSRFWPYVAAALLGTLAGMTLLDRVPRAVLALGLGTLTLSYVLVKQPYVPLPGADAFARRCVRVGAPGNATLGFASGVVFGASNVAVQVVAYLDNLELDRSTFIGVLAMILVAISSVRVGAAWWLGLYGGTALVGLSALAAVPGTVGVRVGTAGRGYVPERYQTAGTLVLLAVIGVRLSSGGLTAVVG